MQDLRLIGVHEDGQHLLLADPEGNRYRVPLDEPLRAAARRDRPRLGQLQIEIDGGMRPREVQALVRAGLSAEEVADRSGWSVEKVRRYEGPILAEREHVANLAKGVRLRGRGGGQGTAPTLGARVGQRLSGRGVDPSTAEWDSARSEEGDWTVIVTFAAGGRQRQARWQLDVGARTVTAADDEARWLSEDDASGTDSPIPAPHLVSTPVRATTVYDVEAEGGVAASPRRRTGENAGAAHEEPLDLMTAMRERASARGRRSGGRRKSAATQTPVDQAPREDALPLEDIAYDPESMPPPPAARGTHPADGPPDEIVGDDVLPGPEPGEGVGDDVLPTPEAGAGPGAVTADEACATGAEELADTGGDPDPAAPAGPLAADLPGDGPATDAPTASGAVPSRPPTGEPTMEPDAAPDSDDTAAPATPDPSAPRPARKKGGRPSVPSWDDVVFGAKPRD